MSQRNKLIVLGTLVVLLGIVAYFQFGRSNAHARKEENTSAAPSAPATASPAAAETASGDAARNSGPSVTDLRELAGWFGLFRPAGATVAVGNAPVFGMASNGLPPGAEGDQPRAEPGQIPWMSEPGKLDGIIKVGNGPARALIQGRLYQVGDRIWGTTFVIVAMDEDSVTLKSGDRVIRRFWHD